MTPDLLPLLMCPRTKAPLRLTEAEMDPTGRITTGWLVSTADPNLRYPVIRGIPRFVAYDKREMVQDVQSFGDQWNYFNVEPYREFFELRTVANTWGGLEFFAGKLVVDAGAGSGMQSRWLAEAGARHVIALELSQSVDGAILKNIGSFTKVDVIQCSIDDIPLRTDVIEGIIMCCNAIHHTRSVEATARELWRIAAPGAECCWNCYLKVDDSVLHRMFFKFYKGVREFVSSMPFAIRLGYAHLMAGLRLVPVAGPLLEEIGLVRRGPVEGGQGWERIRRSYNTAVLYTFDYFGGHTYQHHLSRGEIRNLIGSFTPPPQVVNEDEFFGPKQPDGLLLRLQKPKA